MQKFGVTFSLAAAALLMSSAAQAQMQEISLTVAAGQATRAR